MSYFYWDLEYYMLKLGFQWCSPVEGSLYVHKLIKSFSSSEIDIICISGPIDWDLTESSFYEKTSMMIQDV